MLQVKYLRVVNDLTQHELEKKTGVKRYRLSMAENGELTLNEQELNILAGFFKTDAKSLLRPVSGIEESESQPTKTENIKNENSPNTTKNLPNDLQIADKEDLASISECQLFGVEIDVDVVFDPKQSVLSGKLFRKTSSGENPYFLQLISHREKTMSLRFFTIRHKSHIAAYDLKELKQGTTFMDLCWPGSKGTTAENVEEVVTIFRGQSFNFGDLGWVLPRRFGDETIEILDLLNYGQLEGILEHAIIYGPYAFYASEIGLINSEKAIH